MDAERETLLVALIENTAHVPFPRLKVQIIPVFPGMVVVITDTGHINTRVCVQ